MSRNQSLGEEIGNSITHGVGAIFALVATILMYIKASSPLAYLGVSLYSFGLLMSYLMSCLYHAFKNKTKVKRVFRRFDHLSIYLLIGGTFAPILLLEVPSRIGIIFFIIQWIIIIIGITMKSVFAPTTTTIVIHTILFLILGWSGLLFIPTLYQNNLPLFWLILSGGIAYSLGIVFFVTRFKYSHFVWHFFVLAGSIIQFIGIYGFIL